VLRAGTVSLGYGGFATAILLSLWLIWNMSRG
jgi:hypothetical protein